MSIVAPRKNLSHCTTKEGLETMFSTIGIDIDECIAFLNEFEEDFIETESTGSTNMFYVNNMSIARCTSLSGPMWNSIDIDHPATHQPPKQQLCIKDSVICKKFDECLFAAVFWCKPSICVSHPSLLF